MKISRLNNGEKKRYNELAFAFGSIFNSFEWTELFGERLRRYGIYTKNGDLIGGFILYREKKFGLSICRNPPFTQSIGPFLNVQAENPVAVMSKWKKAFHLMADLIDDEKYSIISLSFNKSIVDTQHFVWRKYKVTLKYTYIIDIKKDLEEIRKNMSPKRRNDIRKGSKDGLFIKKRDNPELFMSFALKTLLRNEKKVDEFYLHKILYDFANDSNSYGFVTYKDDQPIAFTFCIYDHTCAYYLLGGYDSENKHHGAGAMAVWESIKFAKKIGLRWFDFEGSMVPEIERYFRGFGGELFPYYVANKAVMPVEFILKFIKREYF